MRFSGDELCCVPGNQQEFLDRLNITAAVQLATRRDPYLEPVLFDEPCEDDDEPSEGHVQRNAAADAERLADDRRADRLFAALFAKHDNLRCDLTDHRSRVYQGEGLYHFYELDFNELASVLSRNVSATIEHVKYE